MIVAEFTTARGTKVLVDSSYTMARGSREEELTVEEQRRAAKEILAAWAMKQAANHERAV